MIWKNPIIEYYRGKPVRKYNMIRLRVSQFEIKKIIDANLDLELSAREFLEIAGRPCEKCKGIEITFICDNGKEGKIAKGFLKEK